MPTELDLTAGVALSVPVAAIAAGLLAFWFDRRAFNALLVASCTALACGVCALGLWLAKWPGLLVAVAGIAFLAHRLGSAVGKSKEHRKAQHRGGLGLAGLWLFFCAAYCVGYWSAGLLGLLTITLPALALFWVAVYVLAQALLPLPPGAPGRQAFRSLVTFSLGTNYPYYVLEAEDRPERVEGNRVGMLFAGPGLVLADPAHALVVWNGTSFTTVAPPGLTFTGRFDFSYEAVDLRPQLRVFPVEAVTQDGIRIGVAVSIPFRINPGRQAPQPGGSFPVNPAFVYAAVWEQPIEDGVRRTWDQTVPILATRTLRRILGEYTCDQLCEPLDPQRDPRAEITQRLNSDLRVELAGCGIEVLDGWLSNLDPIDGSVVDKRVEAWRAVWQRAILSQVGEARADATWELESAYTEAHVGLLRTVQRILRGGPRADPKLLTKMVALRLVEALADMSSSTGIREELPSDTAETLGYLRKVLGTGAAAGRKE